MSGIERLRIWAASGRLEQLRRANRAFHNVLLSVTLLGVPFLALCASCAQREAIQSTSQGQAGTRLYVAAPRHANVPSRMLALHANGCFEIKPHKARGFLPPCGLAVVWGAPGEWETMRGTYVREKDRVVLHGKPVKLMVPRKVSKRRYELTVVSSGMLRDSFGAEFHLLAPW